MDCVIKGRKDILPKYVAWYDKLSEQKVYYFRIRIL